MYKCVCKPSIHMSHDDIPINNEQKYQTLQSCSSKSTTHVAVYLLQISFYPNDYIHRISHILAASKVPRITMSCELGHLLKPLRCQHRNPRFSLAKSY